MLVNTLNQFNKTKDAMATPKEKVESTQLKAGHVWVKHDTRKDKGNNPVVIQIKESLLANYQRQGWKPMSKTAPDPTEAKPK